MSNSVIQELKNNLDWCVKNAYSDSDDINFGRCIVHSISIPCSNHIQGQKFLYTKLKSTFLFEQNLKELVRNEEFLNSLVIYPIYDHLFIYKLNTYFATVSFLYILKINYFIYIINMLLYRLLYNMYNYII